MIHQSLLLGAALAASLLLMTGCGAKAPAGADVPASADASAAQAGGLVIALDQLTETPQFFDCESGGTAMQIIALTGSDGTPRLAYNTCQVCAGSPYAYFELMQGYLVCQNCGNAFSPSAVGRVSGGCNPKPIESCDLDGSSVTISAETLASAASLFKNWKAVK